MTSPTSASILSPPVGVTIVILQPTPRHSPHRHGLVRLSKLELAKVLEVLNAGSVSKVYHIEINDCLSKCFYALWSGVAWLTMPTGRLLGGHSKESAISDYASDRIIPISRTCEICDDLGPSTFNHSSWCYMCRLCRIRSRREGAKLAIAEQLLLDAEEMMRVKS